MNIWPFGKIDIGTVCDSLEIAEDRIGNFYKFSFGQWKRHHFEVKTLSMLNDDEITPHVFALLKKSFRNINNFDSKTKKRDFYFICLQDHQILKAVERDKNLSLLSLLSYIFTHELVHIVRFCNFTQRFEIAGKNKEEEERIVHNTTYEILKDLPLPRLDYILESYQPHRVCDISKCYEVS